MSARNELLAVAKITDGMASDRDGVPGIDFLEACAVEAIAILPVLPRMCRGCAYRPGTEAYADPITRPRALECVERSHAFLCHLSEDSLGMKTHLCAGWADGLRARATMEA